jgi:arginase family enzyme
VTVDLDALDPAYAPGVSHHEPGGMPTRQLLDALRQIGGSGATIVGADLVELNPGRDINDMSAMVAAKIVRELLGLLVESVS